MAQYTLDGVTYSKFRDIPGAVYTRSGVAYQQNAAGVWTPFDDDTPPISAGVGVDVWQGMAGLFPRTSPTVAQLAVATNASNVSEPAITPVPGVNWLAVDNTSTTGSAYLNFTTVPDNTVVTWSVLVETPDGSQPVAVNTIGPSTGDFVPIIKGGVLTSATITYTRRLGNVWQVDVVGTSPTSVNGNNGIIRYTGQNTRALKFTGFQVSVGSLPGAPYLPATGTVATRGAPSMYLNAPGLIVPSLGVTVVVDVTWPQTLTTTGVFLEPYSSGTALATGFSFTTSADGARPRLIVLQGTSRLDTRSTAPVAPRGSRFKMAVSFDASGGIVSAGGATLVNSVTPVQGDYAGEPIFIGSRAGATLFMNGAINSVSFLKGLRTQAELNALTA